MNGLLRRSTARAVIQTILIGCIIYVAAEIVSRLNSGSGLVLSTAAQQTPSQQPPLMLDQIRELIPILPDVALAGEIESRGINFKMGMEILQSLVTLKAGPQTMRTLTGFISNRPPIVVFSTSQTRAEVGHQILIRAVVKDPDGDPVQYYWGTTAGRIYGDGPDVRLETSGILADSPNAQLTVSVTVIDRRGGSDSYSKTIGVSNPQSDAKAAENKTAKSSAQSTRPPTEPVPTGRVWIQDKLVVFQIEQGPGKSSRNWGFIEVKVSTTETSALLHTVTGSLPGVACRVEFVNRENISEYSFKEPPGIFNDWRNLVVRVRPKIRHRSMRFAISWQTIQNQ